MRRVISRRWALGAILFSLSVALLLTCVAGDALAQRPYQRPISVPGPSVYMRPIFLRRPIYPVRPILPIFVAPRYSFWGAPLYGFGLGLGFSPLWWRGCGPFWGWTWGYNCYALPVYIAGGGSRDLPQLYLKDGSVYNVTDYWLVNNQLHFTTLDVSGTKWNEHTIDFDQLDLQKTVEVSDQRGFRFVLRDEPMQQYLEHHPEIGTQGTAPPPSVGPPRLPEPQHP
jgi:hypothetical protein